MNVIRFLKLLPLLMISLAGGCQPDGDEQSHAAGDVAPADSTRSQSVQFLTLEGHLPNAWEAQTPSSSMRLIQYGVPGSDPALNAEFLVFYFGPGQGGTPAANIARWTSQFSSSTGEPVQPEVSAMNANGMAVTFVALSGSYARGMGMGTDTATSGQTLLAAIVDSKHGNLYIQLHGPTEIVTAERDNFLAFVTGLRSIEK